MTTNRKKDDDAFKLEVAKMVGDQGLSLVEVARSMDVGRTAVARWVAQYKSELLG